MRKLTIGAILGISILIFQEQIPVKAQAPTAEEYIQGEDGYWYSGGVPYERSKVWTTTYYRDCYGNWVVNSKTCRFRYTPVKVINNTRTIIKAPAFVPGWQEEMLKVARKRDEHQTYLRALSLLGFQGQIYQPFPNAVRVNQQRYQYGASQGYPYSNSQYRAVGSYGAQGNTAYGYSYNFVKDLYGSTDLNALYQQSSMLTKGAQDLAGQAQGDFSALVNQAGSNAARVAEILAKGEAASKALQAATASSSSTVVEGSSSSGIAPPMSGASNGDSGNGGETISSSNPASGPAVVGGNSGGSSSAVAQAKAFLINVGIPRCGSCHLAKDGKEPSGKFSILTYPTMNAAQKEKVWDRIFTSDETKRMPRLPGGGHGTLSIKERKAFLNN